jgi:hypothetical protein
MNKRFVVVLVVEESSQDELDTAVVADAIEQAVKDIGEMKPVAMKVARACFTGVAGQHFPSGAFIVVNPLDKVFMIEDGMNQDGRPWNS